MEAFTVANVNSSSWKTVSLTNSYKDMVAVCTVNYRNNTIPEIVRMQNASGSSFQIRLQNPENSTLGNETVQCVVVEAGAWQLPDGRNIEAAKFTSTVTDGKNSNWKGQSRPYLQSYSSPVVLGQVMTFTDSRWSVFWSHGSNQNDIKDPPNASLWVGKHIGEDTDTTRNNTETIGYIVIETGYGDISGIEVEAKLGDLSIRSVTNSPPYTYNFSSSSFSSPSVAVLSQAGMNGADGSWPVLYGANPLSSSQLRLAVDEDQIQNNERGHIAEHVGYIVFDNPLILVGTE